MPTRPRPEAEPQVTLVDRLWVTGLMVVAFADVILVQVVLPLFD